MPTAAAFGSTGPGLSQEAAPDPVPFAQQPSVGQVARVDVSSKVEVVWADNSKTIILPQVRHSAVLVAARAAGASCPGP